MNGAPRKRHVGRDTVHQKKARTLVTPQTATRVSKIKSQPFHHERTNPESEEIEEDEEAAMSQEPEEEEATMPLVVFQCSTCRAIFGDSYAFVCSTEQLWLITLSHVTNVTLSPEVQTANRGLDAGSSYYELLCHNCQTVLGRKYLTTPVALDGIRDLFSFSTEAITSYTLGEPMQQTEGETQKMKQPVAACHDTMQKLATDRDEVAALRREMEKVKGLLVTVDERLAHLEAEPESVEEHRPRQKMKK
ncbi:hypothetical protein PHMEG_00027549 [Phytophthora megakarya]|uniref:Mis18 domain-containing protein n=1 Tax=Phytophthora megakarya TaxID=4795 RepID=A0A225V5E6_9STRA|nr:hypothetical protein PHMEG_00027549 [Phytophthora megakarya]